MPNPSTAKQIFLYIAPFPALVCFKIWASMGRAPEGLFIAACMMLAYCALVIAIARRWDEPTYFDWTVAGYFAVAAVCLVLWPQASGAIFANYSVTGIYACLFATAFFPPIIGLDPFTYHYAKKYTPEDAWGNPVFVRINRIMTYAWAGLFAACMASSLYPSLITRALIPIALIVGVGLPFNLWFPDFYLGRLGLPSLAEQRMMAEQGVVPAQPASLLGPPASAWEAIHGMPTAFSAEAAGDLSATIGFDVTGSETFQAYLRIERRGCTLVHQWREKVDLLIRTPSEVWLAISRKELDGREAFMRGAYTARGNLGILLRMNELFGGSVAAQSDVGASGGEAPGVARAAPQT